MKLNPFHPHFGVTRKTRRSTPYQVRHKARVLQKYGVNHIVGIAQFPNQHTELHHLCQKHGTDKGHTDLATHPCGGLAGMNSTHDYATIYDLLFAQKRRHIKNVLECGIGSSNLATDGSMAWASDAYKPGASLRMWQEYFPNAQIVGLDHDPACLFTDDRIETYQCDQTDPQSIGNFLAQIGDRKFDIIIDDGLHEFNAGVTLFENMIDRLEYDGVYVIEDVREIQYCEYAEFIRHSKYLARFMPTPNLNSNALVVITKQIDI